MIAGILLAAGRGTRFGSNKLLHPLRDGTPLVLAALRNLRQGVDEIVAVVRPDDAELIRLLEQEQANIIPCPEAPRGMGLSLACGVRATARCSGWIIALGDMPHVPPAVIARLSERLRSGAAIVAPTYHGQRGHPVGFGRGFFDSLCRLDADTGARQIIEANMTRMELIASEDAGVLQDIDTIADLDTDNRL